MGLGGDGAGGVDEGPGICCGRLTPAGTGTNCCCSSASARSTSSPFLNGRPCHPSFPSVNETPFPLSVRARIIVGRPVVPRASAQASRMAVRSWPSITIACHPNARQREASASMSCCHIVGRLCPSAFTSVMPHRLSRRSTAANCAASHTDPSGRLSVAQQTVGSVLRPNSTGVQRRADSGTETLAERAGCDIDERQPGRRVPFEVGSDLAQR